MKIVLIDNGHGRETPGKRSPVWPGIGQIMEYSYDRKIAKLVVAELAKIGIPSALITPEETDISLNERVKRVNKLARIYGKNETLLISIHANANANAKAKGWSIYTYPGFSKSDVYATIFWEEAKKLILDDTKLLADYADRDPDYEANFAVLRDTICPAVLTENMFFSNFEDSKYMISDEGVKEVVALHVNAIKRIFNK